MVTVALAIRHRLDDGGTPSGGNGSAVVVICATDLADACRALGSGVVVRTAAAAETAAAIAAGTLAADVDGWVTTSAWVEVIASRAPRALTTVAPIATSPTVVAAAPGRLAAILALCGGTDAWSCLGEAAGDLWGDLGDGAHPEWRELKVGLMDPDSAVGLSVLASAAAGFVGSRTFSVNDPAFADFEGWLATLAAPSASGDADPAQTLVTRPGTYSAAGSVAALAGRVRDRGVGTLSPEPAVASTVVLAGVAGRQRLPAVDPVRTALVEAGWSPATKPDVAPTLKPGVMAALHSLWRAVTR